MRFWSQAPLVRLLLPFTAGIIAAVYSGWRSPFFYIAPCLLLLLLLLTRNRYEFRGRHLHGFLVPAAMLFSGFAVTLLNTERTSDDHFGNFHRGEEIAFIRLVSPPTEKEKSVRVEAEVLQLMDTAARSVSGHAMVYFEKDSAAMQLRYGDVLFVRSAFDEIDPPGNPCEFDYRRYLSFHNIWHQGYVSRGSWKVHSSDNGNPLIAWSVKLRDRLLDLMRKHNVGGKEFAVGAALLLGFEDKLDQEIINAYASTGALHVLSVSGLHVGIIYVVFNALLAFLDKHAKGRYLKALILLLLLWFYASLTGLSPSVLRSATMFSFIIAGRSLGRYTNIYNTLAASALLLLIIQPYLIMQVGFQLSYLAVAGIVYLHPKIYELWQTGNWLLDKVWAITAVSIAAQAATFPLGLHYFHQFPNYFLFSNLLVIPLSTIVIYLGVALFVLSWAGPAAACIAAVFSWMLWLLNTSVKLFEKLPFAVLEGITITVAETWVIYGIMSFLLLFISMRSLHYFRLALVLLAVFLGLQCAESVREHTQQKFIVYKVKGRSAYDFINGRNNVFISDTALSNNSSRMLFHIKHNWWDLGLHQPSMGSVEADTSIRGEWIYRDRRFIQFLNKRIVIIDSGLPRFSRKLRVDAVILAKNARVSIARVLESFDATIFIIDSSSSKKRVNKWKEECARLGVKHHSVMDDGAYIEVI